MTLAAALAEVGVSAEAAGWTVSLVVDAADQAISLQLRRPTDEGTKP